MVSCQPRGQSRDRRRQGDRDTPLCHTQSREQLPHLQPQTIPSSLRHKVQNLQININGIVGHLVSSTGYLRPIVVHISAHLVAVLILVNTLFFEQQG